MTADVGARIRSLRTARGLTQAQLAEPQYTKAYVSMLESGRTRASMKALEHIAGRLGVQPSDLLGGSPSPAAPQYDLIESRRLVEQGDRKSTRLNSSHTVISYAVFCLKKKKHTTPQHSPRDIQCLSLLGDKIDQNIVNDAYGALRHNSVHVPDVAATIDHRRGIIATVC